MSFHEDVATLRNRDPVVLEAYAMGIRTAVKMVRRGMAKHGPLMGATASLRALSMLAGDLDGDGGEGSEACRT
jgi:hypothetical protein